MSLRILCLHYVASKLLGPRVQREGLTHALRDLGHQAWVYSLEPKGRSGSSWSEIGALRRQLARYLHEPSAWLKNLRHYPTERRLIRRHQPDLILVRYKLYHGSALLAARHARVPAVLFVDAPGVMQEQLYFSRRGLRMPSLAQRIERRIWRGADGVITISEQLKAQLVAAGVAPERILVCPNGVDASCFSPQVSSDAVRQRYGLSQAVVGFAGSFAPWHGLATLEQVLPAVLTHNERVSFLCVGEGKGFARLQRAANPYGRRVVFTGSVPHEELPAYLAAMDVCVLPYDQADRNGFYFSPLKLFEYMAMGRPVVASRIGQIPEIIQDRVNGILVPSGDAEAMAQEIAGLLRDGALRTRLGEQARATVLAYHTWQHRSQRMSEFFTTLLKDGQSAT